MTKYIEDDAIKALELQIAGLEEEGQRKAREMFMYSHGMMGVDANEAERKSLDLALEGKADACKAQGIIYALHVLGFHISKRGDGSYYIVG